MSKHAVIVVFILLAFAGCKDTDNAAKWAGTYNGTTGGAYANTFNQVVIQESSDNVVRIFANTVQPTGVYTYAVIQNGKVQSSSSVTFNETDSVLGVAQPLLLVGTVTLNGSILTLQGTGINSSDTVAYYFYGTKQ